MIAEPVKPAMSDLRREPRTSLFVMATLYAASGSSPVKVRDLSSAGALIEAGVIPSPGTRVRLSRGSLNIMGEIVWCRGERAGLRFESSLSVAEWLPRERTPQQRVDSIFHEAKASRAALPLPSDTQTTLTPSKLSAVDLTQLRVAIESLAEDLAADADVMERHRSKLQSLDIAAQALRKLAAER